MRTCKMGGGIHEKSRKLIILLNALSLSAAIAACSPTTSIIETLPSPTGEYIAQIAREDYYGPGQNAGNTIVRLRRSSEDEYLDIAAFNDNNVDKALVTMSWVKKNRLNISFGKVDIGFQAIKMGSVYISYEGRDDCVKDIGDSCNQS